MPLLSENRIYKWGHERRFNSYSKYFRKHFGTRVQKLSVNAGFTCPNRDGKRGTGGCTFCNNEAFNPSYCKPEKSVKQQLLEGITFHRKRYKEADSYLAYFQAFSNTYSEIENLKSLYEEALAVDGVTGLVIGTRPDCIDDEKLDYLKQLSERYYITVEYGVESCYNKTLLRINRGHTFEEAEHAIKITRERGIITGAHFIFGLPGETTEEMMNEASIISKLPVNTVKFHQLQIIKGTQMEAEFKRNPNDFKLFLWEEYLDFIIGFLEHLNPDIIVERFTGEAPPRYLETSLWGKKRTDQIVDLIERKMTELDTWQGKYYNPDIE